MAKGTTNTKNITVFIASPSDLAAERIQFRQAIDNLNDGFGDGAGVTFEALGWEGTLSTVGRRSQSVINDDIDRCEVFILVLNRRWGQKAPDSEYSSYTEEEFYRALELFRSNNSPRIFIFFKRVDPESEGDPDEQLKKVMEFRRSLEETREVLYRYFDDAENFSREVDQHLRAYAKGELPEVDHAPGIPLLPLTAIEAIKEAKEEAEEAVKKADTANEKAKMDVARALELSLKMAEDAAEAALEGKVEKARQRFAMAIAGTTNARILFLAFEFYFRTGDIQTAEEVAQRWLAGSTQSSVNLAAAYNNLGIVHKMRGDLDEAEAMHLKALALNKELGNKKGMANSYDNLGIVHKMRGDLDEAEAMHLKALALAEELGHKEGMANSYGNLGIVHKSRGDLDEAEAMHRKALLLDEELGNKEGMANSYGNLGSVHKTRGDLGEAKAMCSKALSLFEELGSPQADSVRQLHSNLDAETGEQGQ